MSRNEGRTDIFDTTPEDTDVTAAVAPQMPPHHPSGNDAPPMAWSVPTEFVSLPSRGTFYPTDHPLHNQDTVEIRYMTAKEEDILSSRALLKEGLALDRMLQSVIVDRRVDVDTLMIGDKNALLVAARITGYGEEYVTSMTCPSCGNTDDHTFDISEPMVSDHESALEEFGATQTPHNTFLIELPMTQATVECKLLTSLDEMTLVKDLQRKAKHKQKSTSTTDQFRSFIVSVNGDDSPLIRISFINTMPARDARYLRTVYREITPNIDLTHTYVCNECEYEASLEVPLTADFFWPK